MNTAYVNNNNVSVYLCNYGKRVLLTEKREYTAVNQVWKLKFVVRFEPMAF